MLRKYMLSTMLLFCLLVTSAVFLAGSASAASISKNGIVIKGVTMAPCMHLKVTGHSPTDYVCLDKQIASNAAAIPNNGLCSEALILYWNANGGGPSICFTLAGEYNMTDYSGLINGKFINWNDQASSFSVGCAVVDLYTDINQNGSAVARGPHFGIGNFGPGAVPNDTLSSVYIILGC